MKIPVTAGKDPVELRQCRETTGDCGFTEWPEQGKVRKTGIFFGSELLRLRAGENMPRNRSVLHFLEAPGI